MQTKIKSLAKLLEAGVVPYVEVTQVEVWTFLGKLDTCFKVLSVQEKEQNQVLIALAQGVSRGYYSKEDIIQLCENLPHLAKVLLPLRAVTDHLNCKILWEILEERLDYIVKGA